jgi:excisionase family DNA binding protein
MAHVLEPAAVSVPEAARLLGISRRSAYRAAATGEIPTVRIGGRIVVPVHRLHELLDQAPLKSASPASRAQGSRDVTDDGECSAPS